MILTDIKTLFIIIAYFIIFTIVVLIKPNIMFNSDGSLKQFGLGYKRKTILPLWLFAIYLAIICSVALRCVF
jgi:hypothetical protein